LAPAAPEKPGPAKPVEAERKRRRVESGSVVIRPRAIIAPVVGRRGIRRDEGVRPGTPAKRVSVVVLLSHRLKRLLPALRGNGKGSFQAKRQLGLGRNYRGPAARDEHARHPGGRASGSADPGTPATTCRGANGGAQPGGRPDSRGIAP